MNQYSAIRVMRRAGLSKSQATTTWPSLEPRRASVTSKELKDWKHGVQLQNRNREASLSRSWDHVRRGGKGTFYETG